MKPLVLALLASSAAGCGSEANGTPPTARDGGAQDAAGDESEGGGGGRDGAKQNADARATTEGGTTADAMPRRRFRLATTGAELVVSGPALGLELTPANVAVDADVIGVHQEFYGVPWDAFEAQTAPPAEWVRVMDDLVAAAETAKKPVFLSRT